MASKKICSNCKHFKVNVHYADVGECDLMGDSNDLARTAAKPNMINADVTKAYGWDYEGYASGVYVGTHFCCLHFEREAK